MESTSTTFVNLTPHPITVIGPDGPRTFEPRMLDGKPDPCRVTTEAIVVDDIDGVPVVMNRWGPIVGLPDPIEGTIFIVSLVVLGRIGVERASEAQCVGHWRNDIVAPDTGPGSGAIRDDKGLVTAVKRWVRP